MNARLTQGAAGTISAACVVLLAGSLARAQDIQKWIGGLPPGPHAFWIQAEADGTALAAVGDHWIGVLCRPAGDVLTKHLKLKHGLVVDQLVPDAPAEKAGIQQHDILLSLGGKPLKNVVDLVEAVKEAKDQAAEVKLIRAGKEKTINVTPAKRGDSALQLPRGAMNPEEAFKNWRKALPEGQAGGPFRWHRFHPGIVLPDDKKEKLDVPHGLSIAITKQGGDKATVTVKKGDKTWTTSEDKLDELPEDVRPHVKRFLGRRAGIHFEWDASKLLPKDFEKQLPQLKEAWKLNPMPQIRVYRAKPGEQAQRIEKRMREQLKQMQRSLDEMHRQLDSLHGQAPAGADKDVDVDVDVEIEVVPDKKKD